MERDVEERRVPDREPPKDQRGFDQVVFRPVRRRQRPDLLLQKPEGPDAERAEEGILRAEEGVDRTSSRPCVMRYVAQRQGTEVLLGDALLGCVEQACRGGLVVSAASSHA